MTVGYPHKGRVFILAAFLCLLSPMVMAEEQAPFVLRASIRPHQDIWVGQRVLYQVDVLGRNGWAKIQRMPDFQVSGAILVPFESQGTRLNETIGGEAYTGQRNVLSLFPQRSGRISVPAVPVNIEITKWGAQPPKQVLQGTLPPVDFQVETPPGGEAVRGLISTERLTAEQQWAPEANSLKVGNTLKRTIRLSAEDVSAMAFTPILFSASDTIDVYPREPMVEDRYNRGTLTGRRTETVTYVFKKSGTVELPAVVVKWWDLRNKKMRETVLPPRTIEVSASDAGQNSPRSQSDIFAPKPWVYFAMILTVLVVLFGLLQNRLRLRWNAWRLEKKKSEKSFFKSFIKAARSGRPLETLNALMHWLDRIGPHNQGARLDQFLAAYSDTDGIKAADHLLRAMDPESQRPWHGRDLMKAIGKGRQKWLVQRYGPVKARQRLPRLNPGNNRCTGGK
jgi:hypothetical protein